MTIYYILHSNLLCGGNRIAIEHANRLFQRGHNVRILVCMTDTSLPWIKALCPVNHISDNLPNPDWVIATYFETFYEMFNGRWDCKRAYLVQQLENRFFENKQYQDRATNTYKSCKLFDVKVFTIARWLRDELDRLYGIKAEYIPNCQELPFVEEFPKRDRTVVLIEGNAIQPNKGVSEAFEAIKDMDVEKWVLSSSDIVPQGFDRIFSGVSWERALSVIKAADVMIKPSHFEGSPTPIMEAMQLGTPVITTDCTGHDEYGVGLVNSLVYKIGDAEGLRRCLNKVISNPALRDDLIIEGLKTASQFNSWDKSIDKLENSLQ